MTSKQLTKLFTIGSLILAAVLAGYFFQISKIQKNIIFPNGQRINVEIANNVLAQTRGLMDRKSMAYDRGMLFVFKTSTKKIFWMKDTLIPLDMVWIDENFKIVGITKNAQPCLTDACQTYMSPKPVKYVLEINGGISDKNSLNVGDRLKY